MVLKQLAHCSCGTDQYFVIWFNTKASVSVHLSLIYCFFILTQMTSIDRFSRSVCVCIFWLLAR